MSEYFLAPSLVAFRASINAAFPNRDKRSDGWIGDAAHSARPSEHNPCWTCTGFQYGIVRAIDVDVDDGDTGRDLRRLILNSTIGHDAVWYVISNGIIYSRTFDFKARAYTGVNGHFKHVHVSIRKTEAAARTSTLVLRQPVPPVQSAPQPGRPLPDVSISIAAIQRLVRDKQPVSDQAYYDNRQLIAFASVLVPALDATESAWLWYYARRDWANMARLSHYAVRVIQARAGLTQDGVFGAKTGAYMAKFGWKVTP